jgi:hypothetical protein
MTRRWWTLAIAGLTGVWLSGAVALVRASGQAPPVTSTSGKKSGEAFKNVTTSTLKELSVDDFIAAMGVMAAGLGLDCADCHPGAGTDKVDWVIDTPQKRMARRMVEMVATLNRTNFGTAQKVTCWTCHHGRLTPSTTIALDTLYDTPNAEDDDIVTPDRSQPTADQILDKYIQAVGGAQKVSALTSFIAKGKSLGYGELGGSAEFTIYAKTPNQRTTLITFPDHPERGRSLWTFDGTAGWINTPRALLVEYELVGVELDGARLEAQLAFPGQIKQALTNWRSGTRRTIGNKDYQVVQGTGPRGYLATLYFDPDTGLLRRLVRYGPSPVGRVPIQIDYADYRDVNGVKFPFEYKFSWLDGRYTAKIDEVRANVPIEASKFGRNAK